MKHDWSHSLRNHGFWNEILTSASLLVFAVDKRGVIQYINGDQLEQLGRKADELTGKHIQELFPEEDGFESILQKIIKGEKHLGKISVAGLVFQFCLNPILDSQGAIIGASGVGTDITSEFRMEIQVRESEERFRILSEATSEGIAITVDGIIVDANAGLANMLGVPSYQLLGSPVLALFPSETQAGIQEFLTPESTKLFETYLKNHEDLLVPIEVRTRPRPFHDREALVVTIRDISLRKESEELIQNKNEELESINAELQSANHKLRDAYSKLREAHKKRKSIEEQLIVAEKRASLGTMAAGIAHEIAQPLNGLKITVDGMEYWFRQGKKIEFPVIREKLKKVSNHANRINEIITYMRTVFRNQEPRNLDSIDLNSAIQNAMSIMLQACQDENIKIDLTLAENLPPVQAQGLQIEQVVLNLVQNSIQALHGSHSKEKWIQIKTSCSRGIVRLRIADNGIGLGEPIARIFDPFYTTHEAGGGMGLGLCIVQNLVSSWNGKIKAANRKKGGALFTVELPALNTDAH